jgi:hypothetical protein
MEKEELVLLSQLLKKALKDKDINHNSGTHNTIKCAKELLDYHAVRVILES